MLDLVGLPALDLAIGLAFIFFLLSLLAATVQEFIAAILGLRARTLEQGLRSLLEDPEEGWTHVDKFYDHSLIRSLYRTPPPAKVKGAKAEAEEIAKTRPGSESESTPATSQTTRPPTRNDQERKAEHEAAEAVALTRGRNAHTQSRGWFLRALAFFKRTPGPSYISPRSFARVVLDNVAPDSDRKTIFAEGNTVLETLPDGIRNRLKPLLVGAETDVETLRTNLEAFYDDTMARVSGWYKRKTQIILLVIGVMLVPAINANTIEIGERLWKDDTVRAAVLAQAQATASASPTPDAGEGTETQTPSEAAQKLDAAADAVDQVAKVGIPLGWRGEAVPEGEGEIALAIGGWILTILAISLGAPFWFDTLSRLARLRSSGKPETPLPAPGSGKPNERVLTPPQVPTVVVQLHDATPGSRARDGAP